MDELTKLHCDLVAIPSVNPMGRPLDGPEFLEAGVTAYLADFFDRLGVPYMRQKVAERRENIIAWLERPGSRHTVLLEAHQDTVPTDNMVIDPFRPKVENGRVYGRGACDIKGGMAAMLVAFARLVRQSERSSASAIMACTVDEEYTFTGASHLIQLWNGEGDALVPLRPTLAVVAEPTDLDIVNTHKGAVRWKIRVPGRACHSSRPQLGVNAIYRMGRVLPALERYAAGLLELPPNPQLGTPTFNVGLIEGGLSTNTVPDRCTVNVDRRLLPEEDPQQVLDAVRRFLADQPELDFEIEFVPAWMVSPGLSPRGSEPLVALLGQAISAVRDRHETKGVPYGTDAAVISRLRVPTVVFGPGSVNQAHTNDEWLSLDELRLASEVYYHLLGLAG